MARRLAVLLTTPLLLVAGVALGGEQPPSGAKPLSQIASELEKAGYAPIVDASFDDGHWEIEAYQAGKKLEFHVDPMTGEVKSKRADD